LRTNIVDINRVIKMNDLKPVTNPVFFSNRNSPTEDGLFSYEIFGRLGSEDRKYIFAYIDLKEKFLHPLAYSALSFVDRKVLKLISGQSFFTFDESSGVLKECKDDEEGQTGLKFFYKIYDKYIEKLPYNTSQDRKERLDFLKGLPKNAVFQDKLLVCPAYYRDVNFKNQKSGKIDVDAINNLYAKVLNMVNALNSSMDVSFMMNTTMYNIQLVVNQIFDYFIGFISGHNPETRKRSGHGFFHEHVLGKSIDMSVRSVIISDPYQYEKYEDMEVNTEYIGVPLSQCCVLFFDFIMKGLMDFFENEFGYLIFINSTTGQPVMLKDTMNDFSYDNIKHHVYRFIKSPSERFERVKISTSKGDMYLKYVGRSGGTEENTIGDRYLTWTDLLFKIACDVVKDKHVYVTRYPVTDYTSIFIARVSVLSTFKTTTEIIDGIEYKNYPIVDEKMTKDKVANNFIDGLKMFNGYCGSLGADFDGDQVSIRGVWTQEANAEAEAILTSKKQYLDINGKNMRSISCEAVQALFEMTRD